VIYEKQIFEQIIDYQRW